MSYELNKPIVITGDCLSVLDTLETNSVSLIISKLPLYQKKGRLWNVDIPFYSYVDVDGLYYEENEFYKQALIKDRNLSALDLSQMWTEMKQEGLWSKIERVLKPNGTVVFMSTSVKQMNYLVKKAPLKYSYYLMWPQAINAGQIHWRTPVETQREPVAATVMVFNKSILNFLHPVCDEKSKEATDLLYSSSDYRNSPEVVRLRKVIEQNKHHYHKYMGDLAFNSPEQLTEFPQEVAQLFIEVYAQDKDAVVLDPFMRTGKTGMAAAEADVDYIGIDKQANKISLLKDALTGTNVSTGGKPKWNKLQKEQKAYPAPH